MNDKKVLIVDDERALRTMLAELFQELGYNVTQAEDGPSGLLEAASGKHDLVMLDHSLPGMNGLEVLCELKEQRPEIPVIMMTGYASMRSAIEAMKLGAYDYISKPFDLNEVQIIAERAIERRRLIDENKYLKNQLRLNHGFDHIVGDNKQIQQAYVLAAQVADSNASVLVLGETGTGKEYLARSIHYKSRRASGPFVKVSCVSLPETLLESELFGHEKGAFTNAIARRIGRFEQADGGTLFLDEVGDMSPSTQLKLLRVLQEREFERVGGNETLKVDVRIVAATNRDLKKAIADKEFREDLYYRMNVITINLPAIRERQEDIPRLAHHFMGRYCKEMGKSIEEITPEALSALQSHSWPGNIRELQNCMERAVIFCHGRRITPQHLSLSGEVIPRHAGIPKTGTVRPLHAVEKDHIEFVLSQCEGNQTRAASLLGIDRKTLRSKVKEYTLAGD
ncbi:MAG: sigma-54-dependent transcriptional regulator [Armatimonadota bacterium]